MNTVLARRTGAAVYPEEAIRSHRAFITRRRQLRPSEEYRSSTEVIFRTAGSGLHVITLHVGPVRHTITLPASRLTASRYCQAAHPADAPLPNEQWRLIRVAIVDQEPQRAEAVPGSIATLALPVRP
jgi:hypothetical protein